jgi:hypothetical protein
MERCEPPELIKSRTTVQKNQDWAVPCAKIYFFDRSHFLLLLGSLDTKDRQLAKKVRNCYAVIDDRHVITVGHREAAFCARNQVLIAVAAAIGGIVKPVPPDF